MPNPLDRLRELWRRKPWTKPVGLLTSLDGFDFCSNENEAAIELQEKYESDRVAILSLAETRLMDLLPSLYSIHHLRGEWRIIDETVDVDHYAPSRLSALIAWAESDACKETQ